MTLCDQVREGCAEIAGSARSVDFGAAGADLALAGEIASSPVQLEALDGELHYLDSSDEAVARYFLTLDAINFGSGWFPTLRKQPGRSGYATIAGRLTEHFRLAGPWSNEQLRRIDTPAIALALGQPVNHELMALYAQALRDLGRWLGERTALEAVDSAEGSAERFAAGLVRGMAMFRDPPFYKRAQLLASDLELAGVATFSDLDRLTIFADNVVPHVLRCEGILVYEEHLAARIDAEQLLQPGREEREIRACAVLACEQLARHAGVPPRVLDNWLWNRGQAPQYKARPRHRCRCVFY
ncbi:MAG TPA: queuosine salvage family protein [Solirubrobacteraceae bacterium]|nr:queuosine salvage family protein [Solirubrobacteraceae bacterium]